MLFFISKSSHEEHLAQALQTDKKWNSCYLSSWLNWYFQRYKQKYWVLLTISFIDDDFNEIITPPGAYEVESLNTELKLLKMGFLQQLHLRLQPNQTSQP